MDLFEALAERDKALMLQRARARRRGPISLDELATRNDSLKVLSSKAPERWNGVDPYVAQQREHARMQRQILRQHTEQQRAVATLRERQSAQLRQAQEQQARARQIQQQQAQERIATQRRASEQRQLNDRIAQQRRQEQQKAAERHESNGRGERREASKPHPELDQERAPALGQMKMGPGAFSDEGAKKEEEREIQRPALRGQQGVKEAERPILKGQAKDSALARPALKGQTKNAEAKRPTIKGDAPAVVPTSKPARESVSQGAHR